jgi:hypothetical protein
MSPADARWPAPPSTLDLIEELIDRYAPALALPLPAGAPAAGPPAGADGPARFDAQIRRHADQVQVPPPAVLDQVRLGLQARAALLAEYGAHTLDTLADAQPTGSPHEHAAQVRQWQNEGRLLTVPWRGQRLLPGFQFADGHTPHPVLADITAALAGRSDWGRALWWPWPHELLDDQRPIDLLTGAPGHVRASDLIGRRLLHAAASPPVMFGAL